MLPREVVICAAHYVHPVAPVQLLKIAPPQLQMKLRVPQQRLSLNQAHAPAGAIPSQSTVKSGDACCAIRSAAMPGAVGVDLQTAQHASILNCTECALPHVQWDGTRQQKAILIKAADVATVSALRMGVRDQESTVAWLAGIFQPTERAPQHVQRLPIGLKQIAKSATSNVPMAVSAQDRLNVLAAKAGKVKAASAWRIATTILHTKTYRGACAGDAIHSASHHAALEVVRPEVEQTSARSAVGSATTVRCSCLDRG
jgi:hypothetical protein